MEKSAHELWNQSKSIEEYNKLLHENGIIIPKKCPITGKPYFMSIETPDGECVATYGGPFDSYTIPEKDDDGNFTTFRYCHDDDCWKGEETIYSDEI